ncbi:MULTISPECIES: DNA polymerase III subunit beta [unclassified Ectothiorhodospira]|jgi:DNA polymerase-3 subunit beta|uniref:DNA polymerase III subunit beta n=1 Tax=unclassified Ectothiorhodospira TaxID=2684909 RepID=UPI001EE90F08|nr:MULTISPECIES: DNA polymerase III subunit beta [unclassified Ectothiorhodospira]MCG5515467.1 DNA polymerase III subunit beta [Ectothiorhodospira sp. 9100]MCG5518160.1 DNA polymerase III subunit beta [Ectothiorhodospira sp. 9905]
MKFSIERERLLKPLQQVVGAVEKRQTMPILSNVLIRAETSRLELVATDLEVEWVADMEHSVASPGVVTVPARKLLDICKALPEGATVGLHHEGDRLLVSSGRSRFTLSTLPADDYPSLEEMRANLSLEVTQRELLDLIERTSFAMAVQDVRYYLNGLMFEVEPGTVRTVATDGHRLSLCAIESIVETQEGLQLILPRKGVMELSRLLERVDDTVRLELGASHLRAVFSGLQFTSKLIDGRFPDYKRVVPEDDGHVLKVDRELLKQALGRTAILSNDKVRGVRMELGENLLKLQSHNPEQEEAEEELEVEYAGPAMEIGFNSTYLLDVVTHLEGEIMEIKFRMSGASIVIRDQVMPRAIYVVMPIRL